MKTQIDEKFLMTDEIIKYQNTHTLITGNTFSVKSELKKLGAKFTKLAKTNNGGKTYNIVVNGWWVANDLADQANDIVIKAA